MFGRKKKEEDWEYWFKKISKSQKECEKYWNKNDGTEHSFPSLKFLKIVRGINAINAEMRDENDSFLELCAVYSDLLSLSNNALKTSPDNRFLLMYNVRLSLDALFFVDMVKKYVHTPSSYSMDEKLDIIEGFSGLGEKTLEQCNSLLKLIHTPMRPDPNEIEYAHVVGAHAWAYLSVVAPFPDESSLREPELYITTVLLLKAISHSFLNQVSDALDCLEEVFITMNKKSWDDGYKDYTIDNIDEWLNPNYHKIIMIPHLAEMHHYEPPWHYLTWNGEILERIGSILENFKNR